MNSFSWTLLFDMVGGRTMCHDVWVADSQDPCMLGLDFLRQIASQLDLQKGLVKEGQPASQLAGACHGDQD